MIKQIAVAVATIALTGWVSASSVNWSLVEAASDYWHSITGTGSFTLAYLFEIADATALDSALASLQISTGNVNKLWLDASVTVKNTSTWQAYDYQYSTDGGASFTGSGGEKHSNGLQVGKNVVAIVVDRDTENQITFGYYVNGTLTSITFSNSDFYDLTFSSVYNSASMIGGDLYYADGALTKEQIATVPEPTALALLALGVAGLALRRKAA